MKNSNGSKINEKEVKFLLNFQQSTPRQLRQRGVTESLINLYLRNQRCILNDLESMDQAGFK
jgi:hypothetical protein